MAHDIIGTSSSETIDGTTGDDNIYGRGGNDVLRGLAGDDWLFGESGDDTLIGGLGINDYWGGSGADIFAMDQRTAAGFSDDLIWDFTFDVDQIDVSAWGVSDFSQIEYLLEFDAFGDATLDAFYAGHDHVLTIDGVSPLDLISSDFIYANPAAITAVGTSAADVMFGSRNGDSLKGLGGSDIVLGGLGDDLLYGNDGNDDLIGGDGADRLYGGNDSDLLEGNAGNDNLRGDAGRDYLYGGSGNDTVWGGAGTDDLYGGTGADRFIFKNGEFGGLTRSTADYIGDFHHSEGDRIDLRGVDAVTGGTDDAFSFIGNASFSGVAGQLRYFKSDGDTFLAGDLNGDKVSDFIIFIEGSHTIVSADLLL